MSLLANSNAIESGGYPIQRSLRFRSSASAYLNRTNVASPTNNKIFTFSAWIKRGQLSSSAAFPIISGGPDTNNFFDFFFDGDSLNVSQYSGGTYQLRYNTVNAGSGAVFRDVSAWYHIVLAIDMTQASGANGVKLYVNNVQQTWNYTAAYVQNSSMYPNTGSAASKICLRTAGTNYFDGYLAEVNFIDGQALTPSSFGQTDAVTGVWTPKKYTGTYGTNGFYLPFSDNTSATTLAYDKSGNGNNWTPNNISTTAGATYDSMTDVPTLTSATAANFPTLNPLEKTQVAATSTITWGNLRAFAGTSGGTTFPATIGVSSGKWYFEVNAETVGVFGTQIGISRSDAFSSDAAEVKYQQNGNKLVDNTSTAYGATWTGGDVIGCAVDMDGSSITFYKNGISQGTISYTFSSAYLWFPVLYTNGNSQVLHANFGQRPFSYTPPTGFKALNTFNLPDPTIKRPNQYMDATLYSGTSASQTVTNAGAFQPDLVWIKSRSAATNHKLTDSVRGVTKALISNTTGAETTDTNGLTAFNSNGFTVGSDSVYNNGTGPATYVGWCWKKGATPGFDIVTYTGTGANQNIAHSLGVAPAMMLVKSRSTSGANSNWILYHASLGNTMYAVLNSTAAPVTTAAAWNNTSPTSSVFTVGTGLDVNGSAQNQVAYLWSSIPSFSRFGSFVGNGSADGPMVFLGFRPKYVWWKNVSTGADYFYLYDSARGTYNPEGPYLSPSTSGAEGAAGGAMDFLSNGFKVRNTGTDMNTNGNTYIFAAFAENPFKYSLAR